MASDDLRFSRLEELLEIALDLQGSLAGLTLDDIMTRYEVSRRRRHACSGRFGVPLVRVNSNRRLATMGASGGD